MTGAPGALTIVLAGGGTAGHVEPALAVAEALRRRGHRPVVLGTPAGLENRLVPARGFPLRTIPKVAFPRRPGLDLLRLPLRLRGAVSAAAAVLDEEGAAALVGFGGYASASAYLGARRLKVPIVVHEANPLPGMANRLGARLSHDVAVSVPDTPLPHAVVTGLPLRTAITDLDRAAARPAARQRYGLDPARPVLLVTGGSQGARRINTAVTGAAAQLLAAGVQVLHVAGPKNVDDVRDALPAGLPDGYHLLAYAEDMASAYAAADLAVCRSGAVTCAELAAVGLPAVYVPLPIGNGEQRRNAAPAVDAGAGLLVDDAALDPSTLLDTVLPLLRDPARLADMGRRGLRSLPRDAADRVALMALAAAGIGQDGLS